MSNEWLFTFHVVTILLFTWGALRIGREALTTLLALQAVLANFFISKLINLFGLDVTCTDAFTVGAIVTADLLFVFYGKGFARKAIGISFFAMLFVTLMAQLHLLYLPLPQDTSQESFYHILHHSPRIMAASLSVYFLVQRLNLEILSKMKRFLPGFSTSFYIITSLIMAQAVDTVLFSYLGLYGILDSIGHIIWMSLLIKSATVILMIPFTLLLQKRAPASANAPF